jgi:hypothetical protein
MGAKDRAGLVLATSRMHQDHRPAFCHMAGIVMRVLFGHFQRDERTEEGPAGSAKRRPAEGR